VGAIIGPASAHPGWRGGCNCPRRPLRPSCARSGLHGRESPWGEGIDMGLEGAGGGRRRHMLMPGRSVGGRSMAGGTTISGIAGSRSIACQVASLNRWP